MKSMFRVASNTMSRRLRTGITATAPNGLSVMFDCVFVIPAVKSLTEML